MAHDPVATANNVPPLTVPHSFIRSAELEEGDDSEVHDDDMSDEILVTFSPHQRMPQGHNLKQHQRMARWLAIGSEPMTNPEGQQQRHGMPQVGEEDVVLPTSSEGPLRRVRCAVVALVVLGLLRSFALNICAAPGWSTLPAHLVSCASDMLAAIAVAPLVWPSTWPLAACMKRRCLGPLVTTVLVACLCDIGALTVFLRHGLAGEGGVLVRRPFTSGKTPGRHETPVQGAILTSPRVGVWACIIISSVAIEAALCRSTWQLYRSLREAGAYPPGVEGLTTQVSAAELVCEAEDVALLAECKAEDCQAECLPICYSVRPVERILHLDADVNAENYGNHMDLFHTIKQEEHLPYKIDDSKMVHVEQAERSVARHSRDRDPLTLSRADSPRAVYAAQVNQLKMFGMAPVTNNRSQSAPPRLQPPRETTW
mmetsp:Transcript_128881/g.223531  ORF Transcript_128881/g.223531 Transcript_128881/m.223531 type:complete len:427 (+) Transcript_128881:106-1386(+)